MTMKPEDTRTVHQYSDSEQVRTFEEGAVIVRRNDDGTIDEIVAKGATVHVEQMSGNCFFLSIDGADGSYWQFWIGARNNKSLVDVRHTEMSTPEEEAERKAQRSSTEERSTSTGIKVPNSEQAGGSNA